MAHSDSSVWTAAQTESLSKLALGLCLATKVNEFRWLNAWPFGAILPLMTSGSWTRSNDRHRVAPNAAAQSPRTISARMFDVSFDTNEADE